jgi:hypothetical protein
MSLVKKTVNSPDTPINRQGAKDAKVRENFSLFSSLACNCQSRQGPDKDAITSFQLGNPAGRGATWNPG